MWVHQVPLGRVLPQYHQKLLDRTDNFLLQTVSLETELHNLVFLIPEVTSKEVETIEGHAVRC